VGLTEELAAAAAIAEAHAGDGEALDAILVAEPRPGERTYLCAFAAPSGRSWLAFDSDGRAVKDRNRVRAAVSIAALCEVAEDHAGGGELERLRQSLVGLRLTENPPGLDAAEAAAAELEATIGSPPRVASPGYLDGVAAAARRLEVALGSEGESPFTVALQQAVGVVDELARDVEATYKLPLS
jgi:hypothetical protein